MQIACRYLEADVYNAETGGVTKVVIEDMPEGPPEVTIDGERTTRPLFVRMVLQGLLDRTRLLDELHGED